MRRTRLKRRTLPAFVGLVLLAVAVAGSGYLIGKFVLASLFQRAPSGQPVTSDLNPNIADTGSYTVHITTQPLTLYRVQLGAFSTRERAEETAQAAINQGVAAAVMSPDPLHKVYCGITSSKNAAKKLAEKMLPKLSGIVAEDDMLYVATMAVDECNFSLDGNEANVKALENAFSVIHKSITSLIRFWDEYYLEQQVSVDLTSMETDVAAVKTSIEQISPDSSIQIPHEAALELTDNLAKAIGAARQAQGGDNNGAVEGMTAIIELVDIYAENLAKLD